MIFSCNTLPASLINHKDVLKTDVHTVYATFTPDDEDFDPFIEDKVTTPEALSHLLNIGLRGLRRLLHNNRFTEPEVVKKALESYKTENSTVLTWAVEEGITLSQLLEETTDVLFSDFKDWCSRSDIKYGASIRTFHKELEDRYGLERQRIRNADTGGKYKWKFVVKLD